MEFTINRSTMTDEEYMEALEDAIELMNGQAYVLGDCIETLLSGLELVVNIAEISVDQNRNSQDMLDDMIAEAEATQQDMQTIITRFSQVASGGEIH
jgi:hypothetical protein